MGISNILEISQGRVGQQAIGLEWPEMPRTGAQGRNYGAVKVLN